MLTPAQAAEKFNFFKVSPSGGYEMYLDNHALSHLRMCEAYFVEDIINHLSPIPQGSGGSWSLSFGQWLHKCMEVFYKVKMHDKEYAINKWLIYGAGLWGKMKMEHFADRKQYKAIGGKEGAMALLCDYYTTHYGWKETLKVVGCELPFGFGKEVPIGIFDIAWDTREKTILNFDTNQYTNICQAYRIECFLSGRIDMLVDDGVFIGPLDHKTTSYFDGTEGDSFRPHEGMLGYAYATDVILGAKFAAQGRMCRQMIVNHISLRVPKEKEDRFKRSFLQFTPAHFDEYKKRQLTTFKRIFELCVLDEIPSWNTFMCANLYHNDCPYRKLHSSSPETRADKQRAYYQIKPAWTPYNND